MTRSLIKTCRRGGLDIFRKPKTNDPFINATLTSIGPGPDGVERFWISTCNTLCGPSSLLIDENGRYRVYEWSDLKDVICVYGVASTGPDTIWMGGTGRGRTCFVRVTLSTGEWKQLDIPIGDFMTAGTIFDPGTRKLFSGVRWGLVSFDTRSERFARIYDTDEMPPDRYHYDHWRNRDGSYSMLLTVPGLSCLRWFPKREEVKWRRLIDDPYHPLLDQYLLAQHKYVRSGRLYVPYMGWLDGVSGTITRHDRPPAEEANWFGSRGQQVYGARLDPISGDSKFVKWNTRTGGVEILFTLPDVPCQNCALTRSGKIVTVDLHGLFRRFDARTGTLELTRKVDIRREHVGNTMTPAGRDTIVGTPFIAQNFWVLNTKTGKGHEAGRAAGLYGQIDDAVNVGGKVYLSAYGGSQLTEYDPDRRAGYPRNPRLVAKSSQGQHGAGITTDGRVVWVAYKPKYGTLDGAMIRYDTETGEASYKNAALKQMHVRDPMYDSKTGRLVAGSSFLADCATTEPVGDRCFAVTLDPNTMEVATRAQAPAGVDTLMNVGPLGNRKWLMRAERSLMTFDERRGTLSPADGLDLLPEDIREIHHAGPPGLFVVVLAREIRLWDATTAASHPIASHAADFVHRAWVHGRSIFCDCGRKIVILRDVLPRPSRG